MLFGAFFAGILTVLAPCVLPLLPIIIGGSITGGKKDYARPFIITLSLAVSLLLFTLLLKTTSLFVSIPPEVFTYISGGLLILVGISLLFPQLYIKLSLALHLETFSQKFLARGNKTKNSIWSSVIIGAALGPVFASCNPLYVYILISIFPVNFLDGLLNMSAYIVGLCILLLSIGLLGQRFVSKLRVFSNPRGWFQRSISIIFILVGVLILTGSIQKIQVFVSEKIPALAFVDTISKTFIDKKAPETNSSLLNIKQPYAAPSFTGISAWINSKPLDINALKGKVVLVDFWTYSCINCVRSTPYMEKIYQAYKDSGLVIVGVHAPEFAFEKNPANVQNAVKKMNISYPVALDNDLKTWAAFENRSWPSYYLIDAEGAIVRTHDGEGEYTKTEAAVRELLKKAGKTLPQKSLFSESDDTLKISSEQTNETYFGASRASNYTVSPALLSHPDETTHFTEQRISPNFWTLSGNWKVGSTQITAGENAILTFNVSAKNVYLVASSTSQNASIKVTINGQEPRNIILSGGDTIYTIADFVNFKKEQVVTLSVPAGTSLNSMTFGS